MARYYSLAIILVFGLIIAGCGGGGGGGNSLKITPSSVTLNIGVTQTFSATEPVEWRVQEINGGTITSGGVYTAPNVAGTYHVVATSKTNPSRFATATVFVVAPNGVQVVIDPSNVALRPGGKVIFYSNVPVTWKIQETNGGTIVPLNDTSAEYTAPSRNGDYHVIGTSKADPTKSGIANVFVDSDLPPPPPPG